MRKTILFFMSMFFVLGTAIAQDKDESKDFNSPEVYPSSEELVTTVYNIRLVFPKNITVTLPENGIDVVNNETKEVVKITNYRVDEWEPNAAMLLFEQVLVEGKDGKEELQDQYIATPGTYSYTIPSGVIKSVDGDVFAGGTYSFTIVATFPIESYTPTATEKLEKVTVTFDQEITEIKMPSYGLSIVDYYWTPVANIAKATIGEDKKSAILELDTPITTPGTYNLDLYQGVFVSAVGISQYASLMFNVYDPTPSFSTNWEDGSKVQELGNLEITFNNVKEVKLVENGPKAAAYLPGGGDIEGTATLADNKITVSFGQLTEDGEYVFVIPAGMFTMDGVPNEVRELTITLFTFEITPLEVLYVMPEAGKVTQLDKIIIKFNQPITLSYDENWQQISREINLTCGDKTYVLTNDAGYAAGVSDELTYLINAEWTGMEYKSTPITDAGTYTLNLGDIIVDHAAEESIDEWGYPVIIWHSTDKSCEGTYSWTIEEGSAIKGINATEGEQAIYDLLGRRIEKIAGAGIYIVNGKKVVIK